MKNIFEQKTVHEQVEDLKMCGTTIKEAGFNSVWGAFIEDFYENGLDLAKRKVSNLTKQASNDSFFQGQNQAIDFISNVSGLNQNKTVEENWEIKHMNSFEMGKEAAYNEFVELAESGQTVGDVVNTIRETLELDLEKSASQEDEAYRLGIETACYDFLKEAGNVYGEYEVEEGQDELVFTEIFEKMAGERMDKVKDAVKGMADKVKGGATKAGLKGLQAAGNTAYAVRNNPGKAGLAAAGVVGAGAGAYGLKKRHDKKKEQEKQASDADVAEALAVLEAAGYVVEG